MSELLGEMEKLRKAITDILWQAVEEGVTLGVEQERIAMPCGHPRACVVVGTERRDGEYEQHCGWCAEVGILREQLAKLATVVGREEANDERGDA